MKPGAQATRFQSRDFQTGIGNVFCGWAQLTGPYPYVCVRKKLVL